MTRSSDIQSSRGTAIVTFTQTGTYSSVADLGGGALVGCYSDNWPGVAGSLTFRSSWNPSGSGYPVMDQAGVPLRVAALGSGTFTSFTAGTVPIAAQYVVAQVGTGGTAGIAAGGTIVLVTGVGVG